MESYLAEGKKKQSLLDTFCRLSTFRMKLNSNKFIKNLWIGWIQALEKTRNAFRGSREGSKEFREQK